MLAGSLIQLGEEMDFNNTEDLRFHGGTYMMNAENVFKVCLGGVRRQRY